MLALVLLLVVPLQAHAAEAITQYLPQAGVWRPSKPGSKPQRIKLPPGYLVPEDTYRALLADVEAGKQTDAALAEAEVRATKAEEAAEKLQAAAEATARAMASRAAQVALERARTATCAVALDKTGAALAERNKWWRSAKLWVPVMTVVGIVVGAWIGSGAAQ